MKETTRNSRVTIRTGQKISYLQYLCDGFVNVPPQNLDRVKRRYIILERSNQKRIQWIHKSISFGRIKSSRIETKLKNSACSQGSSSKWDGRGIQTTCHRFFLSSFLFSFFFEWVLKICELHCVFYWRHGCITLYIKYALPVLTLGRGCECDCSWWKLFSFLFKSYTASIWFNFISHIKLMMKSNYCP